MSDEIHETEHPTGEASTAREEVLAADESATESIEAETSEATGTPGSHRQNTLIAVGVIAALAVPVVYLAMRYSAPKPPPNFVVPAATAPAPAANIPALEALAQQAPTETNKINLSRAYIDQHAYNKALPLLNEIVAANPKDATAWNNLCVVHMLQQDVAQAIDACGKAINADPSMQLAQNNMKWARSTQQKLQAEIAADEKTTRTEQVDIRDGLDYLHLGDIDHSIGAFKEALNANPKSAIAANNIGLDYALKQDFAGAAPWFSKAITLDPTMQIAKNNLAWAQSEIAKSGKKTP